MQTQLRDLKSLQPHPREWLLGTQDQVSGGWGEHPGGRLSVLNTAEVIIALTHSDVDAGNPQIQKAVSFLYGERPKMLPPETGCWVRTAGLGARARLVADIIRTSLVISALIRAGENPDISDVGTAIDWILSRQNKRADDTGWGFQRGQSSEILPTCLALTGLMRVSNNASQNRWQQQIQSGLAQLTERSRNRNSSFGKGSLTAIHTIHCVLVLQAARDCGFSIRPKTESQAIEWLLNHQDDALAPVEEMIRIDPKGEADYPFLFPVEGLLLRALGGSENPRHRKTQLWNDVQRLLSTSYDENSGGLYGQRVFSWSTAAGLYAIELTKDHLASISPRPPEDVRGFKVGHFILGFAVLLVIGVIYLSKSKQFESLQATIFAFLMLACLLAYGSIGERTFRQLASRLVPGRSDSNDEH